MVSPKAENPLAAHERLRTKLYNTRPPLLVVVLVVALLLVLLVLLLLLLLVVICVSFATVKESTLPLLLPL